MKKRGPGRPKGSKNRVSVKRVVPPEVTYKAKAVSVKQRRPKTRKVEQDVVMQPVSLSETNLHLLVQQVVASMTALWVRVGNLEAYSNNQAEMFKKLQGLMEAGRENGADNGIADLRKHIKPVQQEQAQG